MESNTEPPVVGVRFSKVGKIYHFSATHEMDIKLGDQVVVETSRGWQLGQVAQILEHVERPPEGWKSIDRRATPRDLLLRQMWQMKESEVVSTCRAKAVELRLSGIKIVSAEYSFDGARLIILFSTETEEKYDLKSLRQDMQKLYSPSQVEMRQIGPRDMAKVTCGMGACGLETRCCCLFLTEFSSISIRMAKEQGISLTPSEITGMCGRLRCCLIYEYDTYVEARTRLPKRNKRVHTPQGEGKVVDVVPLRGAVVVDLPDVGRREFPSDEVTLVDEGAPQAGAARAVRQPGDDSQMAGGDKGQTEPAAPDHVRENLDTKSPDSERRVAADLSQSRSVHPRQSNRARRDVQGGGRSAQQSPERQGQTGASGSRQPPGARPDRRPGSEHGQGVSKKKRDRKPGRPLAGADSKPNAQPGPGNQPRSGREDRRRRGRRRDEQNTES